MRRILISMTAFSLIGLIISLLVFAIGSTELKWAIAGGAIGVVGIGLALNHLMLALRTDGEIREINTTLSRIEDLQKEMQKAQQEQESAGPPIIASLQAMSQYYMDYVNEPKGEQNNEKS
ncbi:hypothetical protein ACFLUG_01195 [Chloroflexota bacterium]